MKAAREEVRELFQKLPGDVIRLGMT